jgi:hypothetical protein
MNVGGADGVPLAAMGRDRETAQQDLEEEVWCSTGSYTIADCSLCCSVWRPQMVPAVEAQRHRRQAQ